MYMDSNKTIWITAAGLILLSMILIVLLGLLAIGAFPMVIGEVQTAAVCMLIGGIGGLIYCLRGVYLNACVKKSWDTGWIPWYFIRPFVSFMLGGISYLFVKTGLLLLGAAEQPDSSQLGVWVIAFLAGLNVDKFVARIESIGQTVWGLEPSRQSRSGNSEGNKHE